MNITFGETSARRSHAVGRADGDCEAMVLRGCTGYIVDVQSAEVFGDSDVRTLRIDRVNARCVDFTTCTSDGVPNGFPVTLAWDDIDTIYIN